MSGGKHSCRWKYLTAALLLAVAAWPPDAAERTDLVTFLPVL